MIAPLLAQTDGLSTVPVDRGAILIAGMAAMLITIFLGPKFIEKIRPDLVGSGIKEKYPVQKMGIPFRQMHSWDYSGPYHGYDGFAIFARDMDLAINNPVWGMYDAPWDAPAIAAE